MVLLSKGRLTLSVALAVLSSIDVRLRLPGRVSVFILNGYQIRKFNSFMTYLVAANGFSPASFR